MDSTAIVSKLDGYYDEARQAMWSSGAVRWPLNIAEQLIESQRPARLATMKGASSSEAQEYNQSLDILALADLVSLLAEASIRVIEKGCESANLQSLSHELVDLWSRAQALRSIWFDRYVHWHAEKVAQKEDVMNATVSELVARSVAICVVQGWEHERLSGYLRIPS